MTENNRADTQVLPEDQRRTADLGLACLDGQGETFGDQLAQLLDLNPERTLAVTAVAVRSMVAVLLTTHGPDTARRILESARWDATLAEPDAAED